MIYKVGILGACGRMGTEVAALLSEGYRLGSDTFELSDAVDSSGKFVSVEGTPVRDITDPPRESVHVWIDFSRPAATLEFLKSSEREPIVVCTTGFTSQELQALSEASTQRPLMLCPNTSLGVSLLRSMLEQAPLPSMGFKVAIDEVHHERKVDAPSGTAKALAEDQRKRGYDNISMHSVRAGGVVGEHTVRFISETEEVVVVHRAFSRTVFAVGAVRAAQFLLGKKTPGLYTLQDMHKSS